MIFVLKGDFFDIQTFVQFLALAKAAAQTSLDSPRAWHIARGMDESGEPGRNEGTGFMMLSPGAPSRPAGRSAVRIAAFAATLLSVSMGTSAAFAQSSSCGDIQKLLLQRKSIGERIQAATAGKKQIDAKRACSDFGSLVTNGNSLIKFAETNKDWCQIPDSFLEGVKADHGRAVKIRGQACGAAAKQAQMEKQAREGGGGGGLLGGGGLSGASRLPQGAL